MILVTTIAIVLFFVSWIVLFMGFIADSPRVVVASFIVGFASGLVLLVRFAWLLATLSSRL